MNLVRCNKCRAEVPDKDPGVALVTIQQWSKFDPTRAPWMFGNHLCEACTMELVSKFGLEVSK